MREGRPAGVDGDEDLLRALAPQVLGALVRRHGRFDLAEDAVQEALVAAVRQWPADGRPVDPRAWLQSVASRRLIDALRSDGARRRREEDDVTPVPAAPEPSEADDSLLLLLLCAHPSLSAPLQVSLVLRAVGGLTTAEIARALLVPESTVGQRISRAKQRIRDAGATFERPSEWELPARLAVVRQVVYLVFTEGHSATSGPDVVRVDLVDEAIRLARLAHAALPDDPETTGLLALLLLTDARRPARTAPDGSLVPLGEQDRSRWRRDLVDEGRRLVEDALVRGAVGAYQLQAAIAAVHADAPTTEATDWPQVLALYDLLVRVAPNPVAELNRVVAVAEVHGPQVAMARLDELVADDRLVGHHRVLVVRAHLLERAGDGAGARVAYAEAAARATSVADRRHLRRRADRLR